MALTIIWLMAIVLEAIPLVRAAEGKFTKYYKFFYSYLALVLLRDLCLFTVRFLSPKFYAYAYWSSEPIGVLVGCGLVWEVYKIAFARYPGTARMARKLLGFLFIFASTRIFVKAWNSPIWIPDKTVFELERDLRIVQLALLAGLVILFACYEIPLGRNLKGITYGYGAFLATSVANLALRYYLGDSFQHAWEYLQPICYLVVLAFWCATLWSYAPVPEPASEPRLEADYQSTKRKLRSAWNSLGKGMRL